MKLILLAAVVLTALLYGCATDWDHDSSYYGYYGYEQPRTSYYYDYRNDYPYGFYSPNSYYYYPYRYRYYRGG